MSSSVAYQISELMERISQTLVPIMAVVPARFALLDFPDHENVGDSAIWLGELSYFRMKHHSSPAYVCRFDDFDGMAMEAAIGDGPIFLHGGGNFGDLWPRYQHFREEVIARYPDRTIVQLPQSIHFQDDAAIERSAKVINGHDKFVLLVRDQYSFDFAKRNYRCRTELCPDLAFYLGQLQRPSKPEVDLCFLLRSDKEKRQDFVFREKDVPGSYIAQDWVDHVTIIDGSDSLSDAELFESLARRRLERGLAVLSKGRCVVTDRLHGFILSYLMGLKTVPLDNSYSKISRFTETWQIDLDGVRPSESCFDGLLNWVSSVCAR